MPDRISQYRVARLSLYPPAQEGGHWRYALIASTIRKGIPHTQVLLDGVITGGTTRPTTEEVLLALDAVVRQNTLR